MKITSIIIRPLPAQHRPYLAVVNIIFSGQYAANGLRIRWCSDNKLHVVYPQTQYNATGREIFSFKPTTKEAAEKIERQVIAAYHCFLAAGSENAEDKKSGSTSAFENEGGKNA